MTTITTTIKEGVLVLPQQLRELWRNAPLVIKIDDRRAVIEGPIAPTKASINDWKQAAGIWKNKKIEDPVKWQRSIREEWERTIT